MNDGRVFLKSARTEQWYAGPERWVDKPDAAREFASVEEAVRFGKELGADDLAVVLHYADPACDLVLPLKDRI